MIEKLVTLQSPIPTQFSPQSTFGNYTRNNEIHSNNLPYEPPQHMVSSNQIPPPLGVPNSLQYIPNGVNEVPPAVVVKLPPENYRIMFHVMTQDHKLPDLIWNEQTRLELRSCLEAVRYFNLNL